MNISTSEKIFLDNLQKLSNDELINWAKSHYNGVSSYPRSPFESSGDPMNILERTLGLFNNYVDENLYRFENVLVTLFSIEAEHAFTHPGLLHKFIYIFTNCPPKGSARELLVKILIPIITTRRWINIQIGARNLHYDSLELTIIICKHKEMSFLGYINIEEYLLNSLQFEKEPRFCNIALTYLADVHNINLFFAALESSFKILHVEEIEDLLTIVIRLYKRDKSLSFSYLANWISRIQLLQKIPKDKINKIYQSKRLLSLLLNKFQNNIEYFIQTNRHEGRHIIALLVLILINYNPSYLSPFLIQLYFENVNFENTNKILINKLSQINEGSIKEISKILINCPESDNYFLTHVVTLININKITTGPIDNFDIENYDLPIYISFDSEVLNVENWDSNVLTSFYNWEQLHTSKLTVPTESILVNFYWWQVIDQSYIYSNINVL